MFSLFLRMVGDAGLPRLSRIKHLTGSFAHRPRTETQRLFCVLPIAAMLATSCAAAAPNQPPAGAPLGSTPAQTFNPNGTVVGAPPPPAVPVLVLPPVVPGCNAECGLYDINIARNPNYYGGLTRANSITEIRTRLNALLAQHPHTDPNWLAVRLAQQAYRDANVPVTQNKDHSLKNIGVLLHLIPAGAMLP